MLKVGKMALSRQNVAKNEVQKELTAENQLVSSF